MPKVWTKIFLWSKYFKFDWKKVSIILHKVKNVFLFIHISPFCLVCCNQLPLPLRLVFESFVFVHASIRLHCMHNNVEILLSSHYRMWLRLHHSTITRRRRIRNNWRRRTRIKTGDKMKSKKWKKSSPWCDHHSPTKFPMATRFMFDGNI